MSNFFRLSSLFAVLLSLLGGAVTYTPARADGILYVKPSATGSGDCTSWSNACTLQAAIANSVIGDQIWVQAGTYIPHPSNRAASFILKNELQIYGGFAGTETQRNQRNPAANITILSGDLNGDDHGFANNSENAYHVVRASQTNSSTILDGFTIRGGNANGGPWDDTIGGGMYSRSGNPTLRNLTFSQNWASFGGGMYNHNSSPMLTNVIFSENSATYGGGMHNYQANNPTLRNVRFLSNTATNGGGMSNDGGSATLINVTFSRNSGTYGGGMNNYQVDNPKLTSVTFDRNSATDGGGLYNNGGSATLTNVNFLGNSATDNGGGIENIIGSPVLTNVTFSGNSAIAGGGMNNYQSSNPVLIEVTFDQNSASDGGGLYNKASSPTLTNVTFRRNSASVGGGGAMFNIEGSNPTLTNVTFDMNRTDSWGGGMFNQTNSRPSLTNVTFSSNSATNKGGGMYNNDGSSSRLINVTFSGNSADEEGGGIYSYNNSRLTLTNTIIANSQRGGDCVNDATSLLNPSYNNLIESTSTVCGLQDNINDNIIGVDPKLGPLADNGGLTLTHALLPGSPAIDKGKDPPDCPPTDQRGVPRPQGSHCDIGSFESRNLRIIGNAGAAGVKLRYRDGTAKTVTSQANGNYAIIIPEGWSGTVTPTHTCFTFDPTNLPYTEVKTNEMAQDYAARFNPTSPCAEVDIKINGIDQGTRVLPKNGGVRLSIADVNNGPVLVNGTGKNDVLFIASQRVVLPDATNVTYFSELMGLPQNLLSTKYAFPWYDSFYFNSQLRIVNVSTTPTTVNVRINNRNLTACAPNDGPYRLPAGASVLVSCGDNAGRWRTGPLVVQSSGQNIIASLRVLPKGGRASFSETIGLPESQWTTRYAFSWYDNKTLNSQLRIGNVGNSSTRVRVFIGGLEAAGCTAGSLRYPFIIDAGDSLQVQCPNVNNGPVKVIGSAGIPIVASLRIIPKRSTSRFSEVMGLPAPQWTNRYTFPWYDNKTLDTQLRIGNIGNSRTQVRVWIGTQEMKDCASIPFRPYPYTIPAGLTLSVSCPNVNNGPLKLIGSAGVPIVVSLRVLPRNAGPGTVFSEVIGFPLKGLVTGYLFPWYDNKTLDTQLRLAVP